MDIRKEMRGLPNGTKFIFLEISGVIQLNTVKKMEEIILQCYEEEAQYLILDFAKLQLINSTGLGVLVKMHDMYKNNKKEIILVSVTNKIDSLFTMLGIETLFRRFASKDLLLEEFGIPKSIIESTVMDPDPKEDTPKQSLVEPTIQVETSPGTEKLNTINVVPQQIRIYEQHHQSDRPTKKLTIDQVQNIQSDRPTKKLTIDQVQNITQYDYMAHMKYYSVMQEKEIYPLEMSLQKMDLKNELKKNCLVEIIPSLPGCIIMPPYRKMQLDKAKTLIKFDITPVTTGKLGGFIQMQSTKETKPQHVRLETRANPKKTFPFIFLGLLFILFGFILNSFTLKTANNTNIISLLIFPEGLFYPFISLGTLSILWSFLRRTVGRSKKTSLEIQVSFRF